jgi:isoleucyl-tRNA synthetase
MNEKWIKLFKIKQEANIAIEEKRANKEIGSSLEAELKIITDKKTFDLLEGLDLAEYFITSKAEKEKVEDIKELKIIVKKTTGNKCPRCWKILEINCIRCQEAKLNKN